LLPHDQGERRDLYPLTVPARPTPIQQKAFDLLGVAMEPVAQQYFKTLLS
jgi:hypothetical protein